MSMKPGHTTRPVASMRRFASPPTLPTPVMREPWTVTLPTDPGAPVPSTINPFSISRSCITCSPVCIRLHHAQLPEERLQFRHDLGIDQRRGITGVLAGEGRTNHAAHDFHVARAG